MSRVTKNKNEFIVSNMDVADLAIDIDERGVKVETYEGSVTINHRQMESLADWLLDRLRDHKEGRL